ncbi:MAG: phosphate acyltransferase PlsX [Christensenellales bacterium]
MDNTRVILDCYGGDNCPHAAVEGAVEALNKDKTLSVVLTGKKQEIESLLATCEYDSTRLEIIDTEEVITNDDSPAMAIRRKKNSSMVVGLRYLADGGADAMVSSGNTGALLTGASVIVKLIDGVTRASLSAVSPQVDDGKYVVIVDGGANVDCKAEMLLEFAVMGDSLMKSCYGVANPRVALLSNGAEEEKGNALTKEAHALLKESNLNFVGNIEARYLMNDIADVVVTDGWAGNMVIKASEGMALNMFELIKRNIKSGGLRAKLGYLMLKPALRGVKKKFSSDEIGGGIFLGVNKVVMKAHGSSGSKAFCNAILACAQAVKNGTVENIRQGLADNAHLKQKENKA